MVEAIKVMEMMSVVATVNVVRKKVVEVLQTMKAVEMLSTAGIMKAVESDWLGRDDEGSGDDEHGGAHGTAQNDECSGDDKGNRNSQCRGESMSTVGVMSVMETMKVLKMMRDDDEGDDGSRTNKQSRAIKDVRRD